MGIATCAACAVPGDASQVGDGDNCGGCRRRGRAGAGVARRIARRGAFDCRLCAAAALPRLRHHCRRRSAILSDLLVVARFPRRTVLLALFNSLADCAAWRADRVRCVPCEPAAVRGRSRGARLWPCCAYGGAATQIWAADRARAVDGAADGAAPRGAWRGRCDVAGARAATPLAALVARIQSGCAGGRRTGAADRRAARPSSAFAEQVDRIAARQGPPRARAHRRRGVRIGPRCQGTRDGAASGTGRRCPCQRRDATRGGAGAGTQRRDACFGAHLGARCSRCADDGQHI